MYSVVHRDSDGEFKKEHYYQPNPPVKDFYFSDLQETVRDGGDIVSVTPVWTVKDKDTVVVKFPVVAQQISTTCDSLQVGLYPICWYGKYNFHRGFMSLYSGQTGNNQFKKPLGMQHWDTFFSYTDSYELYKNGKFIDHGTLSDWTIYGNYDGCYWYNKIEPDSRYLFKLSFHGLQFHKNPVKATAYLKFSTYWNTAFDFTPPTITSLQIFSNGTNVDVVAKNAPSYIDVSVQDDVSQVSTLNLYYHTLLDSNWKRLDVRQALNHYQAAIPAGIPSGLVSLRVQAIDQSGNELDYRAEPAFEITDRQIKKPPVAYNVRLFPPHSQPGEKVTIKADVYNSSSIKQMFAVIKADSNEVAQIELYDDGAHSDNRAGDGLYSNSWITLAEKRDYAIDIKIVDTAEGVYAFAATAKYSTKSLPYIILDKIVTMQGGTDLVLETRNGLWARFYLKNIGEQTAENVMISIFSMDKKSNEMINLVNYGNFASGECRTLTGSNPFTGVITFYAHPKVADGDSLHFKALFKYNDQESDAYFTLKVRDTAWPNVESVALNDKIFSPGETINITATAYDVSGIDWIKAYVKDGYSSRILDSLWLDLHHNPTEKDTAINNYAASWACPAQPGDYDISVYAKDKLGNINPHFPDYTCGVSSKPFTVKEKILLVMDNHRDTNGSVYDIINRLNYNGYQYDIWDCYFRGMPSYVDLLAYENGLVIWHTHLYGGTIGSQSPNGLYNGTVVRSSVRNYLDNGGNLFLIGNYVPGNIWAIDGDFLNNYLHAKYAKDYVGLFDVKGVPQDPITDDLNLNLTLLGGVYATEIDPIPPAESIFHFFNSGSVRTLESSQSALDDRIPEIPNTVPPGTISSATAGLRCETGKSKLVFITFPWFGIIDTVKQNILLRNTLEWFQPCSFTQNYAFDAAGWYMVSLPGTPADNRVRSLFKDSKTDFAWQWDDSLRNYQMTECIAKEKGYWILLEKQSQENFNLINPKVGTLHFKRPGWQMLGITHNLAVSDLRTFPEASIALPIYGWDAKLRKYCEVESLKVGQAYWVPVLAECDLLTLNAGTRVLQKRLAESFIKAYGNLPPPPPDVMAMAKDQVPEKFALWQNYPNPFNESTIIYFDVPYSSDIEIDVWDILGQKVKILFDGLKPAGRHRLLWDGTNRQNSKVATGIYFISMKSNSFFEKRKLVFIK